MRLLDWLLRGKIENKTRTSKLGCVCLSLLVIVLTITIVRRFMFTNSDESFASFNTGLGPVSGLIYSPDGKMLLLGSTWDIALLVDATTGRQELMLRGQEGGIMGMAFSDNLIITATLKGTVFFWDKAKLKGSQRVSLRQNESIELWDAKSSSGVSRLQVPGQIWKIALDDAKNKLAVAHGLQLSLLLTERENNFQKAWTVTTHGNTISSLMFSHDGTLLAAGSCDDGLIRIIDTRNGNIRQMFRGHENSVLGLSFLKDERFLISGSTDGTVKVWDLKPPSPVAISIFQGHMVTAMALAPDEKILATGGIDKTLEFWDLSTGTKIAVLTGHRDQINCVQFSPDGRNIATTDCDGALKIWKPPSLRSGE